MDRYYVYSNVGIDGSLTKIATCECKGVSTAKNSMTKEVDLTGTQTIKTDNIALVTSKDDIFTEIMKQIKKAKPAIEEYMVLDTEITEY